jgi:hypothetical protein
MATPPPSFLDEPEPPPLPNEKPDTPYIQLVKSQVKLLKLQKTPETAEAAEALKQNIEHHENFLEALLQAKYERDEKKAEQAEARAYAEYVKGLTRNGHPLAKQANSYAASVEQRDHTVQAEKYSDLARVYANTIPRTDEKKAYAERFATIAQNRARAIASDHPVPDLHAAHGAMITIHQGHIDEATKLIAKPQSARSGPDIQRPRPPTLTKIEHHSQGSKQFEPAASSLQQSRLAAQKQGSPFAQDGKKPFLDQSSAAPQRPPAQLKPAERLRAQSSAQELLLNQKLEKHIDPDLTLRGTTQTLSTRPASNVDRSLHLESSGQLDPRLSLKHELTGSSPEKRLERPLSLESKGTQSSPVRTSSLPNQDASGRVRLARQSSAPRPDKFGTQSSLTQQAGPSVGHTPNSVNFNARNKKGETPLDIARSGTGGSEIGLLLEQYGARTGKQLDLAQEPASRLHPLPAQETNTSSGVNLGMPFTADIVDGLRTVTSAVAMPPSENHCHVDIHQIEKQEDKTIGQETCEIINTTYNFKYSTERSEDGTMINIIPFTANKIGNKRMPRCMILKIDGNNKAILEYLYPELNCLDQTLSNNPPTVRKLPGIGKCFLNFAIKKAKEAGSRTVSLLDAADFICDDRTRIRLDMALLITNGHTWYEGNGFKPDKEHMSQYATLKSTIERNLKSVQLQTYFPQLQPPYPHDLDSIRNTLSTLWANDCKDFSRGINELWEMLIQDDPGHGRFPDSWEYSIEP